MITTVPELSTAPPGRYRDYDNGIWTKGEDRVWRDDKGRGFRDLEEFNNHPPLTEDEAIAHAYYWLSGLGLRSA
jgi:hypothetical protein